MVIQRSQKQFGNDNQTLVFLCTFYSLLILLLNGLLVFVKTLFKKENKKLNGKRERKYKSNFGHGWSRNKK